jgi:hypothetical protein
MLAERHLRIFARFCFAPGEHGHSTTEFSTRVPLLGGVCPASLDTQGNPLHLILAVEFHLLQFDFFQEIFRAKVGCFGDSLQFRFVVLMLFCQTLILGVCFEKYVPRVPLQCCHAFLLMTDGWIRFTA